MTKLISILIILAVVFVGYRLYVYWEKVQDEKYEEEKAAQRVVTEGSLAGLPWQLEQSLQAAKTNGATGLKKWLDAYGAQVQDPRLAWIELDYCVMQTLNNPAEAKRVYEVVRNRTATNSPVYKRVKQLEKTFE